MQATIELPDEQAEALSRFCETAHVSQEEAIRLALDWLLHEGSASINERNRRAAFGSWKNAPADARQYIDDMRAEWDERPGGQLK